MTTVALRPKIIPHFNPEEIPVSGHITVLTKGGQVIRSSTSSLSGVPRGVLFGRSCHSEIGALKPYIYKRRYRRLRKCQLWNIRYGQDGSLKGSKPCAECLRVMRMVGITEVIYSTDNGEFVKQSTNDIISQYSSGYKY